MTTTFPQFITDAGFAFTHGLFATTETTPRIAAETDSGECHVVGLPCGKPDADNEVRVIPPRTPGLGDRAWKNVADRSGVRLTVRNRVSYRQSIDAVLRRDVGLHPDGATFDPVALASAWLAPHREGGKPGRFCYRARVDGHTALYDDAYSAHVAPHALPLDGAVLTLRVEDMALFALAVRYMAAQGLDVTGRAWPTQQGSVTYWTLWAGVEQDGEPRQHAALIASPARPDIAADVRVRALVANAQRERATFVVSRAGALRLFAGGEKRALVVAADGSVSAHADGAARATRVAADEVDGVAAVGIDGAKVREVIDNVPGERLRFTVADTRTPVVVSDADAAMPPVFGLILPCVDAETYLAPVPPRVA